LGGMPSGIPMESLNETKNMIEAFLKWWNFTFRFLNNKLDLFKMAF
jgi:hypothetical protein